MISAAQQQLIQKAMQAETPQHSVSADITYLRCETVVCGEIAYQRFAVKRQKKRPRAKGQV